MILITGCRTISHRGHSSGFKQVPRRARRRSTALHIAAGGPNWTEPVTLYRWQIEDPIIFQKQIRVSIEHGHANRRADDISSVAFWYQTEPHKPFEKLADVQDRIATFRGPFHNWDEAFNPKRVDGKVDKGG